MSDKKTESGGAAGPPAGGPAGQSGGGPEGGSGGLKAWLPLLVTIVLMPALAFTTTQFVILPKVVQARGGGGGASGHEPAAGESGHEAAKDPGEHGKVKDGKAPARKKQTVPITKVIVNVAGSMGARYLMASFTLVGTHQDFKTIIEENKDQLLDLANTAMASKTITELEKPGARNQLRAELMSVFNNALGGGIIQEIYFTEFAVQ
jgi:flagellar FliL protein